MSACCPVATQSYVVRCLQGGRPANANIFPMTEPDDVWRPVPLIRWTALIAMPISVVLPVALIVNDLMSGSSRPLAGLAFVPVAVIVVVQGYKYALTPFIAAREDGIEVRNPRDHHMIPWDDVVDISPGSLGLTIRRRTDSDVVAWAVQKSNIARCTRNHTRADDVAAILRNDAVEHGAKMDRLDSSAAGN
ncbi:MAG: hypothetical protein QOI39_3019 [Mycobacterium sp.]|nr:hypothetical protein [Mycobacterium sp.]